MTSPVAPVDPRPSQRPAPSGGRRFGSSMADPSHWSVALAGAQTVGAAKATFRNDRGVTLLIQQVSVHVGTAPTGADLIYDVNHNGTTVFTDQTKRPRVLAGATDSAPVAPNGATNIALVAPNDTVTVDLDQIGSTVAGSDALVVVDYIEVATGGIGWQTLRDGYVPPVLRNGELLPVDPNPGLAPVELGVL